MTACFDDELFDRRCGARAALCCRLDMRGAIRSLHLGTATACLEAVQLLVEAIDEARRFIGRFLMRLCIALLKLGLLRLALTDRLLPELPLQAAHVLGDTLGEIHNISLGGGHL